eukprot:GHVU01185997.1.p1 GENE.GHVU01185997.1~~GHVU01185997.1.p1  ORF type:complete len:103 (-),score=8.47 GHVU01185997.1:2-310(-)
MITDCLLFPLQLGVKNSDTPLESFSGFGALVLVFFLLDILIQLADQFRGGRDDVRRAEAGARHFPEQRTGEDPGHLFRVAISQTPIVAIDPGFLQQCLLRET